MITVKLVGGSCDGETVFVHGWQRIVYAQKPLSLVDRAKLDIDGITAWRPPDEVYERNERGEFVYARTVHYKPAVEGK